MKIKKKNRHGYLVMRAAKIEINDHFWSLISIFVNIQI